MFSPKAHFREKEGGPMNRFRTIWNIAVAVLMAATVTLAADKQESSKLDFGDFKSETLTGKA
jgi:hypothetical protein